MTRLDSSNTRDGLLESVLRCPDTGGLPLGVTRSEATFDHTRYARIDGVVDFVGFAPPPSGLSQRLMESPVVSGIYEATWRPALTALVTRQSVDEAIELALAFIQASRCGAVLDVACGTGNFTRAISDAAPDDALTVGVDISWAMLRNAEIIRERMGYERVRFVRGDAQRLPFADSSFDAVHCSGAFHLIADKHAALAEFYRVLRPGGRVVLGTFIQSRIGLIRKAQLRVRSATGFTFVQHDFLLQEMAKLGFAHREEVIEGAAITLAAEKV